MGRYFDGSQLMAQRFDPKARRFGEPFPVRFLPDTKRTSSPTHLVPAWSGHRLCPPGAHRLGLAPEAAGVVAPMRYDLHLRGCARIDQRDCPYTSIKYAEKEILPRPLRSIFHPKLNRNSSLRPRPGAFLWTN